MRNVISTIFLFFIICPGTSGRIGLQQTTGGSATETDGGALEEAHAQLLLRERGKSN